MIEEKNLIGTRIKKARKDAGINQQALAEALGLYQKDISRWERGEITPRLEVFAEICKALNVSADELLGIKDTKQTSE